MDSTKQSLIDKYKVDDEGEDVKHWSRILDLEPTTEIQADWYSLRTFEIFLDAIDINQPVIPDDKRSRSKLNIKVGLDTITSNGKLNKLDDQTSSEVINQEYTHERKQNSNVETILSAEALKILSELPDLSHMSATRSFIFPNSKKKSPK